MRDRQQEQIVVSEDLASSANLLIMVSKLEHTTSLIDVVYALAPLSSTNSKISITAVQLVEPTMSVQDPMLPADEDGRLCSVEPLLKQLWYLNEEEGLPAASSLLPLLIFCTVIGADSVDAFKIRGSLSAYALELRNLSTAHRWNLALMAWGCGEMPKKLFFYKLHVV